MFKQCRPLAANSHFKILFNNSHTGESVGYDQRSKSEKSKLLEVSFIHFAAKGLDLNNKASRYAFF